MKMLLNKVIRLFVIFLFMGNLILFIYNKFLLEFKKLNELQISVISIIIFMIYFSVVGAANE